MTGRDLIVYILENHLEDEPIFKDGKFIGLETSKEYASRQNVGDATVRAWHQLGYIEVLHVPAQDYILKARGREV